MSDFQVTGADDFYRLSKALKAAGRTEMRKQLNKAVREAAKPVIKDVKAAARSDLPHGGGLNERMAKARTVIKTKTGKDPGVTVAMPQKQEGYLTGNIRHPVFATKVRIHRKSSKRKDGTVGHYRDGARGGKARWAPQKINGDWFDGTVEKSAPTVLPHIEKALQSIADEVVRRAK